MSARSSTSVKVAGRSAAAEDAMEPQQGVRWLSSEDSKWTMAVTNGSPALDFLNLEPVGPPLTQPTLKSTIHIYLQESKGYDFSRDMFHQTGSFTQQKQDLK